MSLNNYPQFIEVEGVRYKLNTDYRVALKCFEVIEDPNIDDYERALAVIYLLIGDIPGSNMDKILKLLAKYLRCGEEEKQPSDEKKDMDLLFDSKYIIASFMSDYQMDLPNIEYLHYYQFMTLISGLTGDCILNRIRDIRTCDLKDYKGKSRTKMEKAKRDVALPVRETREDIEAMNAFDKLFENNVLDQGDYLLDEE